MTLAVFGLLHHADASEFRSPVKPFDVEFIRRHARLYDQYGYERVLIGQHARSPDPLSIASYVSACTENLKFMIAHRPGFIAPTMAARMFATVDRLSNGRCAAHIITAGSDVETQFDGDFLTKDQRYERSREYVDILRSIWSSDTPIDHAGEFYTFKQGFSDVKPSRTSPIPIFWGGASDKAIEIGAASADVYAMGGGPVEKIAKLVSAVRAVARPLGRDPGFCMSMRIIMAPTEGQAWDRAYEIRDAILAFREGGGIVGRDKGETSVGAVVEAERLGDRPDPHLWNGLTVATKGRTHITALVGTPDQLTGALMNYHEAGIGNAILTGFDPIEDTIAIGTELIPRLKRASRQ